MKTSRVIAKFTGADGSLGYHTGQIYILEMLPGISWVKVREALNGTSPLAIRRVQNIWQRLFNQDDGFCPYETREAFEANWQVLEQCV